MNNDYPETDYHCIITVGVRVTFGLAGEMLALFPGLEMVWSASSQPLLYTHTFHAGCSALASLLAYRGMGMRKSRMYLRSTDSSKT